MKLSTLEDLLLDQIKDIYFAEKHLTKALPKLARAAESDELKQAFTDHLKETQQHVVRLERVFKMLGAVPKAKRCPAIIGLVEEGGEMIDEDASAEVRDAGLIAAAQRVEHYEIAAYGCARAFAKRLGLQNVADVLTQTIEEEGNADKALTVIAEGHVNDAAASASDDEDLRPSPRSTSRSVAPPRASARRRPARGSRRLAGASA